MQKMDIDIFHWDIPLKIFMKFIFPPIPPSLKRTNFY
jgi:hypothetical protein